MTALAKKAVKGGPLHHLHPGSITVHRGVTTGSASHKKLGTSWTKAKSVVRKYASDNGTKGHAHSMEIDVHTPAIDVNKLLKKMPSKSATDREVFVAKGPYKTKIVEAATAKRLCNGPNCGVKTTHKVDTDDAGNTVWRCENCGHTTPKTTRMTAKKKALDDLFNKLSK
jgi:uncharacterized Zn finger protein